MSNLLWKPLLAATLPADADLTALPYPLYASPKIDGFRAMVQDGKVVSRKGIKYRNEAVQAAFGKSEFEGLDGELCVGSPWAADVLNRTQNVVNSGKEEAAVEFVRYGGFHIIGCYDKASAVGSLHAMYKILNYKRGLPKLRLITQKLIRNGEELTIYEAACLAKGFEGVMLRRADGPAYPQKTGKDNRSTLKEFWLVKLKRFDYDFADITAIHLLEHNANEEKTAAGKRSSKRSGIVVDEDRVGAVTLRAGKLEFRVNVQTSKLRDMGPVWWKARVGRRVRYKHQAVGRKDLPRFPQCTFEELM